MWTGVHLEKAVEDQAAKKGLHRQQQEQETPVLWAGFSFSTRATSCHAGQQQGAWPKVIQSEQGQFFSRCSVSPLQPLCLASPAATTLLPMTLMVPFHSAENALTLKAPSLTWFKFLLEASLSGETVPDYPKWELSLLLLCFIFLHSTNFHLKYMFIC